MVSIRRRRLLGQKPGLVKFFTELPVGLENSNPVTVKETKPKADQGTSNSSKEQQADYDFPEVKRRKKHRRKHSEQHEACIMRGVYYKNMKWQAAIKVDKKQIHLGTVSSQTEAARLYDRAAFLCGREPNFELSLEEKQELRKLKWEDFLEITRTAISKKKHRKKNSVTPQANAETPNPMQTSEWEGENGGSGPSASEDVEADTPMD